MVNGHGFVALALTINQPGITVIADWVKPQVTYLLTHN